MKRLLVLFIIILFFNMSSISSEGTIGEKSLKLISDGNILYVGGSGEGNYTKIQDAIDNANDSDTVFVYDDSSPYNENLIVSKSINLFGEDKNTTIINGSLNQNLSTIIISSEHVILSGFTIQRYGVNNYTYNNSVIYIQSDYNIISGNILTGNITCGIQIDDSQYNNISGNVIKNDFVLGQDICRFL
jgi:parallel beta-helix repeat protein